MTVTKMIKNLQKVKEIPIELMKTRLQYVLICRMSLCAHGEMFVTFSISAN